MVSLKTLQAIIPLLQSSGVRHFKMGDLEVDFRGSFNKKVAAQTGTQVPQSLNETKVDEVESKKATDMLEGQLPVDLRTDGMSDVEKILFWSSGAAEEKDESKESLPLTGDQPDAAV